MKGRRGEEGGRKGCMKGRRGGRKGCRKGRG